MNLDDNSINKIYGNFRTIIDQQLTIDNEDRMVDAFQAVACILATKRAVKSESEPLSLSGDIFLEHLKQIKNS
jgi:hypothetical protein